MVKQQHPAFNLIITEAQITNPSKQTIAILISPSEESLLINLATTKTQESIVISVD